MDNSWVKLYRKIAENEVLFDDKALRVFIWLLTNVDKRTGETVIGRYRNCEYVKLKPTTFYDVLKRLEKKYKIVTCKSDNKKTVVSLLNWAKYNKYNDKPTGGSDTKVTPNRQQSDTIQDNRHKTKDNINILDAKRPLSEKQKQYYRITDHLQKVLNMKITTWEKQLKAIKTMLEAGYTELQIIKTIDYMANKDEFYSDKGFDMTTVSKQIALYKAQMRKSIAL